MTISVGVTGVQIAIFVILIAAALLGGPAALAIAAGIAVLWTLTQVFTSGLMTTQMTTIVVAIVVGLVFLYTAPALLVVGCIGIAIWYFYPNSGSETPSSQVTPKVLGAAMTPSPPPPVPIPLTPLSSPVAKPPNSKSAKAPSESTYESKLRDSIERQAAIHQERKRRIHAIEVKYPQLDPNHMNFDRRLWQELQLRIAVKFQEGNGPINSITVAFDEFQREHRLDNPITANQHTSDSQ